MKTIVMTLARSILELRATCFIYSMVIVLADFIFILVFHRELSQVRYTLSLVLLVEGGLALTTGGVVGSFSPTIGKIGGSVFHSKPWDAKRLKDAERTARIWIVTGLVLFLLGLLVSAL
jgi:hypothetical protein